VKNLSGLIEELEKITEELFSQSRREELVMEEMENIIDIANLEEI
jgi:hypothetical protein